MVSLSTDDPPILTALAAGHVTITAAVGRITVVCHRFPGGLPLGTVLWSNPGDDRYHVDCARGAQPKRRCGRVRDQTTARSRPSRATGPRHGLQAYRTSRGPGLTSKAGLVIINLGASSAISYHGLTAPLGSAPPRSRSISHPMRTDGLAMRPYILTAPSSPLFRPFLSAYCVGGSVFGNGIYHSGGQKFSVPLAVNLMNLIQTLTMPVLLATFSVVCRFPVSSSQATVTPTWVMDIPRSIQTAQQETPGLHT